MPRQKQNIIEKDKSSTGCISAIIEQQSRIFIYIPILSVVTIRHVLDSLSALYTQVWIRFVV
jgi:hypothetical protein